MDSFWDPIVAIATSISTVIAAYAIFKTVKLTEKQILLERRQQVIPLWSHIKQLSRIDPHRPNWDSVTDAVNGLELIAIAWEGGLVDRDILRRMYKDLFIEFFESIQACAAPSAGDKSGHDMLKECPSAMRLYNELMHDITEGQKVPGVD